jgi:hypothetical protein
MSGYNNAASPLKEVIANVEKTKNNQALNPGKGGAVRMME